LILKAYENKTVTDTTLLAAAVANAVGNVLRKKGKRPQKLWHKKPQKTDKDAQQRQIAQVLQAEAHTGTAWVEAIYRANGRRYPRKENTDAGT